MAARSSSRHTLPWRFREDLSLRKAVVLQPPAGQAHTTVNAGEADRLLARLTEVGVRRPLDGEKRPQGGRPALR